MSPKLTVRDAVDRLDGHAILSEPVARQICATLDLPFPEKNLMFWQTAEEAYEKYGFFATQAPSTGIDGLDLSYHVANELGLGSPGGAFCGKGFQSRANQQAIRQHLSLIGKL
jgi:hypothetical protein